MENITTTSPAITAGGPHPDTWRELLRWDGDLFALTGAMLEPPAGAVALTFDLRSGPVLERNALQVTMRSIPTPTELVDLVRRLQTTWTGGHRRGVVVRFRLLDEREARAEWGDR